MADGNVCDFHDEDLPKAYTGVFFSDRRIGLTFIYRMNAGGAWDYWDPTEIDGYPAATFSQPDHPTICSVAVGVTDETYFSVASDSDHGDDKCARAKDLAVAVLSTIKRFS